MKILLISLLFYYACNSLTFAQLVTFEKINYKINDQVKVKLSYIDSTSAPLDSIKVFSDLLPNQVLSVNTNSNDWTILGKIKQTGIYNFRFRFKQDTSRYFQLAILSPTNTSINHLSERIPFTINISSESLSQALIATKNGLDTLKMSNWPQLTDSVSTKKSAWLIAYKAYQISNNQHQLIAGTYCLLKSEQVGSEHVKAILTSLNSSSISSEFIVASQILMATPSLVTPTTGKFNIADFLTLLLKQEIPTKKIRFHYSISSQEKAAIYGIGIN